MPSYMKFTRSPYKEPDHLHLFLAACNGRQAAEIAFFISRDILANWAQGLEGFPLHRGDVYLWEHGSERPKDKWAYYLKLRVFTTHAAGHCAIHLRLNNNAALPELEISEFCIEADAAAINRLGGLFRAFGNLEHEVLIWTPTEGRLIKTSAEAEPQRGADESQQFSSEVIPGSVATGSRRSR